MEKITILYVGYKWLDQVLAYTLYYIMQCTQENN